MYRGFEPALARAVPANATAFLVYELAKNATHKEHVRLCIAVSIHMVTAHYLQSSPICPGWSTLLSPTAVVTDAVRASCQAAISPCLLAENRECGGLVLPKVTGCPIDQLY